MSYAITTTSGNLLLTLQDGTVDSTTGLNLIGRNYTSYGSLQNDNFIRLAENFAAVNPPSQTVGIAPLVGTLWFDTAHQLIKVFDGTNYNPVSGRLQASVAPTAKNIGDQWWDTTNLQLKSWTGATWQVIGPLQSASQGKSGEYIETIVDTIASNHTVVSTYTNNNRISIASYDAAFTPSTNLLGFTTITPGINLSNVASLSAPSAAFTGNITAGNIITSALHSASVAATAITAEVATINGNVIANSVYDNGNRVITRVIPTAGSGISLSNVSTSGPTANLTINNTGVVGLIAGTGTGIVGTQGGSFTITNTGVTHASAGVGIAVSNSVGSVTFSIGQEVYTYSEPTFNGLGLTGNLVTTFSNVDIGTPSNVFNAVYATTFVGTASTALFADLAEKYIADANYAPGTVVVFGGEFEITLSTTFADTAVAGVVSTDPAYLMNSKSDGLPIALRGRVPVQVIGPTKKGDLLVTSDIPGYAISIGSKTSTATAAVFAKSLTNKTTDDIGVIEAVII